MSQAASSEFRIENPSNTANQGEPINLPTDAIIYGTNKPYLLKVFSFAYIIYFIYFWP
jgi:hypothetical protein